MANTNNVFLSKLLQKRLDDSDTKFHIYLQTKWLDDEVELLLQDSSSNKCYKGRLANEEVRESASDLEIPYHEFYEEIYGALTTNLSPEFICEIGSEELAFKLIKRKNFDVVYVEVKLREVQGNHELLETAIELIAGMSQEKEKPKETHQNGQSQVGAADQGTVMYEAEKKKLLKKFAMLLNTKKAKIEELQEKLETLQSGDAAMRSDGSSNEGAQAEDLNVKASTSGGNKRAGNGRRRAIISDDDDDDYSAMTQPMTQAL